MGCKLIDNAKKDPSWSGQINSTLCKGDCSVCVFYHGKEKIDYINNIQENPIIKLDLDSHEALNEFVNRVWIIKNLGLKVDKTECYDTKHGYHVYLYLDNILSNFEILIIEGLLFSDFRKQLYNYLKIKSGTKNWDILFKEKSVINHLDHRICLSKEQLNQRLSEKIMNLISFGIERKTGIFTRKPKTEEGKKAEEI